MSDNADEALAFCERQIIVLEAEVLRLREQLEAAQQAGWANAQRLLRVEAALAALRTVAGEAAEKVEALAQVHRRTGWVDSAIKTETLAAVLRAAATEG